MAKKYEVEMEKPQNNKYVRVLLCTLILILGIVSINIFFNQTSIKPSAFYPLTDKMESKVYYKDGTMDYFEDGNFGRITKGNKVRMWIRLPKELPMEHAELYLPLYNGIVNVYLNNTLLYEDSYDESDVSAHYGNRIYEVPLPDNYASKDLVLEITAVVGISFSDLEQTGLVPVNEGWKKIVQERSLTFIVLLTLMSFALFAALFFLIRSIQNQKLHIGLPISLFEVVLIAWFFGSMGMFYLIFGNVELCAKAEYYALYMIPIPLSVLIYEVVDLPVYKTITKVVFGFYFLYYVFVTQIELSSVAHNYSEMILSMHIMTVIVFTFLMICLFRGTRRETNRHIYILQQGAKIAIAFGLAEFIRFDVDKYVTQKNLLKFHGISVFALAVILVYTASVVLYLIFTTIDDYMLKLENRKLAELAYMDVLTQLPNRADCYRQIDRLLEEQIKEYSMVFIDVNNLKTANDTYGHDTGDRFLKAMAQVLKDVFEKDGFCTRWGGDEFVACVFGDEQTAKEKIKRFQKAIAKIDSEKTFPFKVSAACGYAFSDEEHYLDPLVAIRQADTAMYENKKRMKVEDIISAS
ncbi:MAG: GGDEF domain-containing protein [Lachnospiraceae bacterium]|jgi:diguanylate cyclase (GGDEF)-like protein|nr:GGDEF domain-containing protein [Lachnospiraceae bacterium]